MTKTIFENDVDKYLQAVLKEFFRTKKVEKVAVTGTTVQMFGYVLNEFDMDTVTLARIDIACEKLSDSKIWPHVILSQYRIRSGQLFIYFEAFYS